jgi:hypothetical protein
MIRLLPVLCDIAKFRKYPPIDDYFSGKEHRHDSQTKLSDKYVLLTKEMLKQWNEYMTDCGQLDSAYCNAISQLERHHVYLPNNFTYFFMRDYVKFIINWTRINRRPMKLSDRLGVYNLF